MLDRKELQLLRCPVTRGSLAWAPAELVEAVREKLGDIEMQQQRRDDIEAALITEDGTRFYPIVDGIPKLLADEAIDLVRLGLSEPPSAHVPPES